MKLYRYSIICFAASFVFLTMIAGTVAAETNYIEGPVYSGLDLHDIIGPNNTDFIEMNAQNFAGFYLDTTDNVSTETLRIYGGNYVLDRMIWMQGLVYTTQIKDVNYEYTGDDWNGATYEVVGLFGDAYVPLKHSTTKLSRLLIDCDKEYTLNVGESLDLGSGYAFEFLEIDVGGDKVWVQFTKDNSYLADKVLDISQDGYATWEYDMNIANEVDVPVFRVHLTEISEVDNLATIKIEGLWLIDHENVLEIRAANQFGILEVINVAGQYLVLSNENPVVLMRDSIQEIAEGMEFKVADSNDLIFYLRTEYTEPTDICPPPQDNQPVEVPTSNIYITTTVLGLVVILGWKRK